MVDLCTKAQGYEMILEEEKRLQEQREKKRNWRKWGPYLSERQWGTVREDYSANADAWNYVTHDQARSYVYRWGEDGLAGISDDQQLLCFCLSLWNEKDPILKERLFGLTGSEGNHGEDIKEYNFYLDNLPTHAYMKYLYKYPQKRFPYEDLVEENRKRSRQEMEYELLDTHLFEENRYFDLFVEYAKGAEEDLLIQITAHNRGNEKAPLHLLPTLWFRNDWSFEEKVTKPKLFLENGVIVAMHPKLGNYFLFWEEEAEALFTDNETNKKDAIHRYIIGKEKDSLSKSHLGTKVSLHHEFMIDANASQTIRLRLSKEKLFQPFSLSFEEIFAARQKEADAFYQKIAPSALPEELKSIQRQAFAGLLWNKQCYHYNVRKWLDGDPKKVKPPEERKKGRNHHWSHLDALDVFSMPDKWEYPWFASWDLAFHTVAFALIDPDFAKDQLLLLTREWYMHSNGQIPAYEWEFSDVNPPVHAWAALRVYQIERANYGREDRNFLARIFQKLLLNFTWWVNRKDEGGKNIFEGGFLGLDNIGPFDRSKKIPGGAILEQPDGTGWMAMYSLNLLEIALELALLDPSYEDMATKFFEHFIGIASAINHFDGEGLWDEEEGQYCGVLRFPDGKKLKMKVHTIVGFIPLFAVAASHIKPGVFPDYRTRFDWYVEHRPDLLEGIGDFHLLKKEGNLLLSLVSPEKLKVMLSYLLDETRFLSPYGIRSVSKEYQNNPYQLHIDGKVFQLDYEPKESTTALFGGNSNWRGPIWFPINYLLIESLQKFYFFLGDSFQIEYPIGSGKMANLWEISLDLTSRLIAIFVKNEKGERPLYGGIEMFQKDPHWQDYILFHEYFHGDNGAGLGASNQTGWTALIAKLIQQYGVYKIEGKLPFVIQSVE